MRQMSKEEKLRKGLKDLGRSEKEIQQVFDLIIKRKEELKQAQKAKQQPRK